MSAVGRRLATGASWVYGLQVLTVVVQLGYAALTSRSADPSVFGAYSVALSIAAFVNLLGSGGLAQTAARAPDAEHESTRPLATYAIFIGVGAALFTLLTANLWSALWAAPQAAGAVRLLALSALVLPMLSLSYGLLRRAGLFRDLAVATFVANVAGMVVGAGTVAVFKSPESLAVSAIVGQWGTLIWAVTRLRGALVPGRLSLQSENVRFSTKIVAVSIFQYISGNAPRWSVSHFVGTTVLGSWNRADVLTTVPFSQLQNALMQVIYPEFRRYSVGSVAARAAWLDMLNLIAWLTLPLGAVLAGVGPVAVRLLLGPGWGQAAALVPLLALLGALQPIMVLFAGVLESASLFRAIWVAEALAFLVSAAGVAMVIARREYVFAIVAMILATLIRHLVHLMQARQLGALGLLDVARGYSQPVIFGSIVYGSSVMLVRGLDGSAASLIAGGVGIGVLLFWIGATRRDFGPLQVLRRRGILRDGRS